MARSKKKRQKKYRPAEAGPTVHRYVAEAEARHDRRKVWKRRLILLGIIGLPLLLVAWWLL